MLCYDNTSGASTLVLARPAHTRPRCAPPAPPGTKNTAGSSEGPGLMWRCECNPPRTAIDNKPWPTIRPSRARLQNWHRRHANETPSNSPSHSGAAIAPIHPHRYVPRARAQARWAPFRAGFAGGYCWRCFWSMCVFSAQPHSTPAHPLQTRPCCGRTLSRPSSPTRQPKRGPTRGMRGRNIRTAHALAVCAT